MENGSSAAAIRFSKPAEELPASVERAPRDEGLESCGGCRMASVSATLTEQIPVQSVVGSFARRRVHETARSCGLLSGEFR